MSGTFGSRWLGMHPNSYNFARQLVNGNFSLLRVDSHAPAGSLQDLQLTANKITSILFEITSDFAFRSFRVSYELIALTSSSCIRSNGTNRRPAWVSPVDVDDSDVKVRSSDNRDDENAPCLLIESACPQVTASDC